MDRSQQNLHAFGQLADIERGPTVNRPAALRKKIDIEFIQVGAMKNNRPFGHAIVLVDFGIGDQNPLSVELRFDLFYRHFLWHD